MFYLGQPYSHPEFAVREKRYLEGAALAARLVRDGFIVYAPIVHWHAVAELESLPTDFAFWQRQCCSILARCDLLIVYQLNGWAKSKGLAAEISFAEANGIPILYFRRFPDGQITSQLNAYARGTGFPIAGREGLDI